MENTSLVGLIAHLIAAPNRNLSRNENRHSLTMNILLGDRETFHHGTHGGSVSRWFLRKIDNFTRIDHHAVPKKARRARGGSIAIFCLPAFEGAPLHVMTLEPGSLREALEARAAIVTCAEAGGVEEIIPHSEDGVLVPANDPAKL